MRGQNYGANLLREAERRTEAGRGNQPGAWGLCRQRQRGENSMSEDGDIISGVSAPLGTRSPRDPAGGVLNTRPILRRAIRADISLNSACAFSLLGPP